MRQASAIIEIAYRSGNSPGITTKSHETMVDGTVSWMLSVSSGLQIARMSCGIQLRCAVQKRTKAETVASLTRNAHARSIDSTKRHPLAI
jgi:hypothetical protein